MKIKLKMTEKLWQGWKYWKNKTQLEKDAIDSMLKAKDYILKNIPKKEIVSIYARGSFVRREMTKNSDIDLLVILKTSKYLRNAEKIGEKVLYIYSVPVHFSFFTLKELETGKIIENKKEMVPPRLFLSGRFRNTKSLIYGEELPFDKLAHATDQEYLERVLFRFDYSLKEIERNISWKNLIKDLFYLIESEQWVKGKETPIKYREMASLLENKNPIIKEIVYYLLDTSPEEVGIKERKRFVKQAKKYIKNSHYWYYKKIKNKSTFYAWKKLQIEKIDPWIGHIGERINKNSPKTYKFLKKIKPKIK